jgi:hypothetical protein
MIAPSTSQESRRYDYPANPAGHAQLHHAQGHDPSIQLDQEQAIAVRELDATAHPPLQHDQLMSEHRILSLKSALRLERRGEQGKEEA